MLLSLSRAPSGFDFPLVEGFGVAVAVAVAVGFDGGFDVAVVFCSFDQGSLLESRGGKTGSTNHLSDHFTSDHDSLFELPDLSRGGKAPNQANDVLLAHQGAPRAALHANQLRVIRRAAQHPVHPYRQLAGDRDLRHSAAPPQLQPLVVLS